ncbi:DegT/DnrJ/EryC1/StrS family aminotransferase [Nocardia sp. bgisy118]|uniref:DegT/DnrJ/EryC1/StrS family aminotransferase n=1 Tax=Nocardia sp. bgisy118 TaxID=3413786 RepID=UPI003F49DBA6
MSTRSIGALIARWPLQRRTSGSGENLNVHADKLGATPNAPAAPDLRVRRESQPTSLVRNGFHTTHYSVDRAGLPYHLSAVHAAVGRVQQRRHHIVADRRITLWRAYAHALADIDGVRPIDLDIDHTIPFHPVVRVPDRDTVFAQMTDAGIAVGVHYPPNHTQPAFLRWTRPRPLPATETTARQLLSLPFHPR